MHHMPAVAPVNQQLSLADLGTRLSAATFVVVDLETTGGPPAEAGITEFGAVKVTGGQVIGEFATLVNPGSPIPPFIAALTGITDSLVATAPRLTSVLPSFLEFARGSVLVAHNAPYDIGFLKGACLKLDHEWPGNHVIDTARLARLTLHRDEVANCKLATLAAYFRTDVTPTHRAFDDARATADVLHRLLERVGDFGVETLEDLAAFTSRVTSAQRTNRHLATGLPDAPGVYIFRDPQGEALYVGTSKNIRKRVRTYFTASETRRRMDQMITIATSVDPIVCATTLEARVRELRLIATKQPRYNQQSKRPERQTWLKLTAETAPRLAIVREVRDDTAGGACYLGPFRSSAAAQEAAAALQFALPLRVCSTKLARKPRSTTAGCALAELGKCLAPCTSAVDHLEYDALVERVRSAMSGAVEPVASAVHERMRELADQSRFEDAALWRDRLAHFVQASVRTHQLMMLADIEQVVAAKLTSAGGWEVHCIRYGALAGAATIMAGVDPLPVVAAMIAAADVIPAPKAGALAALTEEAEAILAWLGGDFVRLVRTSAPLALPIGCGGALLAKLGQVREEIRAQEPVDYQWLSAAARSKPVTRIA